MRFKFYILTFILIYSICGFSQIKNIETDNGLNIFYYPNGQISSVGIMENGNPVSVWKSYYVDGVLKSVGIRKNGFLDSTWCFYNEKGIIKEEINYFEGKKSGYYITYKSHSWCDTLVYIYSKDLYVDNKKNGNSEVYFEDGKTKISIQYKDGQKFGFQREYDINGNLIEVIEYRNGVEIDRDIINRYSDSLRVGIWKSFYENGNLKVEENYIEGKLNGLRKEYNKSGELIKTYRYQNGVLVDSLVEIENEIKVVQDYYNVRDENGQLIKRFSGSYSNGKPIGVHRTYDSLGRVNSSRIYDSNGNMIGEGIVNDEGDKVGEWKYYFEKGALKSIGYYETNRRFGEWKYFYETGKIEQKGNFKSGLPNGEWLWYYEDGMICRKEYFKNGKEDGEVIEYSREGKVIVRGNFVDGLKEGEWFFDYGFQYEKGNFKNNLLDGRWLYFYENNKIYFEGNFVQGLPDGEHIYYYRNGKWKEKQNYLFGRKEKNWEYFNDNGEIIKILTYENDQLLRINGEKIENE
jgi:uncharacterized protein